MIETSDSEFYRALLRAYIDSANDAIFVLCDEMKFLVANPLLESWLAVSEANLTLHNHRRPIIDLMGSEDSKQIFSRHFEKVLTGQPARFECFIQPVGATARWVEFSLGKVKVDAGMMFIGVARDVTERKLILEEMEHHAIHDHMTGLFNRREFERHLEDLLKNAKAQRRQHALLYMDLDQFKVVNDTCGHIAGDILISQLSSVLGERIRASDMLARLGGDEFGLLMEDCPIERAQHIAEKHREAIKNFSFTWQDKTFKIGVSIGLVPINAESESAVEVMSAADSACYVAKNKGGNRIHLDSGGFGESHTMRGEMGWVAKINRALQEDRFCLYYQNVLPVAAPHPCSEHYEILLRMIDDDGAIVLPMEFIPAAEKYNLMPAIDRWVIHTLFAAQGERWRTLVGERPIEAPNDNLFCAINLSGASLNDDSFLEFLHTQIAEQRIPPGVLCFEITETVAINNLQQASNFIREFKALGCRFALDDFGSGMSSFAYLKNLPVDYLKIDGTLVTDIVNDPVSRVMVEAINKICQSMNIRTVAEFVENHDILRHITEIGMDYAQGYAIHKPAPLADYETQLVRVRDLG